MKNSPVFRTRVALFVALAAFATLFAITLGSSNSSAERSRNFRLRSKALLNAPRPVRVATVAGPFTVNTTNDTHASSPASSALDGSGNISLRSAIEAANAQGGTSVINLPPGTYNLSVSPFELQVGSDPSEDITINGTGTAANTIIHQTVAGNRVFNVDFNFGGSVAFTVSNVTISGGVGDVFGGGAIVDGDPGDVLTVSNCVITGNSTTATNNGGAISFTGGGDVTIQNSVISGNTATQGVGGGLWFDNGTNPGNLTITNSTFANNTASSGAGAGQGGGAFISIAPGSTGTIERSVFANNSAQTPVGQGGGMFIAAGVVGVSHSAIVENTAAAGSGVYSILGGTTTTANDNWWGCNSGPGSSSGCSAAANSAVNTIALTWLQLRASASPSSVCPNDTSTVTADIKGKSSGGALTTELNGLPAFPVTPTTIFSNATLGSVSGASTQFVDGVATATFTAGGTSGSGGVDATAEQQTVTASIAVQSTTTTNPSDQSVCEGSTATFSTTASGSGPFTFVWKKGATVLNNGDLGGRVTITNSNNTSTLSISNVQASDNGSYSVETTGGCGTATGNATLTVKQNTSTTKPNNQVVCEGSTASFSTTASGTGPFSFVWKKGATVLNNGDLGGRVTITNGSTTSTLTITNAQPSDSDTYTVETTGACNTASQSATLSVNGAGPTITLNGQSITLWPPNHQYHTVSVTDLVASASDPCDPNVTINSVKITKVTSDEVEDSATGADGNTLNDIVIAADCKSVQLRAERDGDLDGRVYTITFSATDSFGHTTTATAVVTVPLNQNGGSAVDSGPHYTVTGSCP